MSDAGFVVAGYVITAVVLVAYVAWMAWRFRRVGASMPAAPVPSTPVSDEEIGQAREPGGAS